ncbi:hypothetical protein, partial [Sessilibacter corallicola]|uniref:hypothetical protein n=1 Tax=Sessilibacter corallicola TaxID=2904075 RepID=UPI003341BCF1
MKKVIICCVLMLSVGCSNLQNNRSGHTVQRIGEEIRCPSPPSDIVTTLQKGKGNLNLKINEVQKIALDSGLDLERKYQKIREIDPQLQTVETVHYRLCIEYTNGTFTKDEYKELIKGLPLYGVRRQQKPTVNVDERSKIQLPVKSSIAPLGAWHEDRLDLSIKVKWIGGDACFVPCNSPSPIKAGLEITTSSYQMPNYPAIEGFSTAFTHENVTYKLTIEEIKTRPAYIVISVNEIKT